MLYADISTLAREYDLPLRLMERSMNEPGLLEEALAWRPDVFLVAG